MQVAVLKLLYISCKLADWDIIASTLALGNVKQYIILVYRKLLIQLFLTHYLIVMLYYNVISSGKTQHMEEQMSFSWISLSSKFIYIYCFLIVQKAKKVFSADACMWQKVNAPIRACSFCPSISQVSQMMSQSMKLFSRSVYIY